MSFHDLAPFFFFLIVIYILEDRQDPVFTTVHIFIIVYAYNGTTTNIGCLLSSTVNGNIFRLFFFWLLLSFPSFLPSFLPFLRLLGGLTFANFVSTQLISFSKEPKTERNMRSQTKIVFSQISKYKYAVNRLIINLKLYG